MQYFQKLHMQNYFWWNSSSHYSQANYPNDYGSLPIPPPLQKCLEELSIKCESLEKENEWLKKQLEMLQQKEKRSFKRKVVRRTENELTKCYYCPYERCKKEYASSLALNLHIKIKHKGGNKKERDLLAEAIIKAEKEGRPAPKSNIVLPPNYVEDYRRNRMDISVKFDEDGNEESSIKKQNIQDKIKLQQSSE